MEGSGTMIIKKGIRRQIVHYFLVVFIALLLIEVIFLIALRSYYYDTVYNHIVNHINTANAFISPSD